jgi:hypothetical protein
MGLFANAMNELEAEVDRPDGIGVSAEALEELELALTTLGNEQLPLFTEEARAEYDAIWKEV